MEVLGIATGLRDIGKNNLSSVLELDKIDSSGNLFLVARLDLGGSRLIDDMSDLLL